MKFLTDFVTLSATLDVDTALKKLEDCRPVTPVVLTRDAGYFYVYELKKLLVRLRGLHAKLPLQDALKLREDDSVWVVSSRAKPATGKIVVAELRNDWTTPKPYAVILDSGAALKAVVRVEPAMSNKATFAKSVMDGFGVHVKTLSIGTRGLGEAGFGQRATGSKAVPKAASAPQKSFKKAMRSTDVEIRQTRAKPSEKASAPREGAEITRWPLVEPKGSAVPGQQLQFKIDLLLKRPTSAAPESKVTATFEPDWTEERVYAHLRSPFLRFEPGKDRDQIVVRRDKASVPCVLTATVRPEAKDESELEVIVTFHYKGRFSGSCCTIVPVIKARAAAAGALTTASPGAARSAPAASVAAKASTGEVILTEAAAPDLTVEIKYSKTTNSFVYDWALHTGERWDWLPPKLDDNVELKNDPRTELQEMLKTVAPLVQGQEEFLEGLGVRIYDATPPCFKKLYWKMREQRGDTFPIQFITNDPTIPWELMRPYPEGGGNSSQGELLYTKHPVARWITEYRGTMPSTLPGGKIFTLAPDYKTRPEIEPLDIAVEVSKDLQADAVYHAQSVSGNFAALKELLQNASDKEKVAILHIGGHGKFIALAPDASFLYLDDEDLHPAQIRNPRTTLGERCRSVIILNACELAETGPMMDAVGGWADAVLSRRFSGFVAPLWSVYDDDAGKFSEEFLKRIWRDEPRKTLAEALCEIRTNFGPQSASFFAYVYYGDVMAKFR